MNHAPSSTSPSSVYIYLLLSWNEKIPEFALLVFYELKLNSCSVYRQIEIQKHAKAHTLLSAVTALKSIVTQGETISATVIEHSFTDT